jgi:hypothetical protein
MGQRGGHRGKAGGGSGVVVTAHTLKLRDDWGCLARQATVGLKVGDRICGESFNYGSCVKAPGHDGDHLNVVDERWPQRRPRPRCPECGGRHG